MPRHITRHDLLTQVAPAAAAVAVVPTSFAAGSQVAFHHGVASGDPTQTQLIIWTRVTTSQQAISVDWVVSTNADFSGPTYSGLVH